MQNINSLEPKSLSVFKPMKKKLRSERKMFNRDMLAEINWKVQSHCSGTHLLETFEIVNYIKGINDIHLNTVSLKSQAKKVKDDLFKIYKEIQLFENEILKSPRLREVDKSDILDCGISEDLLMLTRKDDLNPINIPAEVESQSLIFDTNMLSNVNFLNESAGSQVIETQLDNMKLSDKKSGENRPSPMIISSQSSIKETKNAGEVLPFLENNQLPVEGSVRIKNDIKNNSATNMSIDETYSSDKVNTKSAAGSNRMDIDSSSSQMSVCFIEGSPSEIDTVLKTQLFDFKRNINKINDKDVSSSTKFLRTPAKRICGEKQPKTIAVANSFQVNNKALHYNEPDSDSNSIDFKKGLLFDISNSTISDIIDENIESTDDLKFIKECEDLSGLVKRFLNIFKATRDDTELQNNILKQISDIPNLKEPKKILQLEKFLTGLFDERFRIMKENLSMKTETLEDSYEEIDQLGLLYPDIFVTLYELYHNLKEEENDNNKEIFLNRAQDQLAKCLKPQGSLDPDFKDLLHYNYNQIEELRQAFLGSDEDLEEWTKNFKIQEESKGGARF